MTDLPTLAATLLANFATVRIPRHEGLWTDPVPELPLEAHCRSQAIVLKGEHLVADCHRHLLRQRLLNVGHRAYFDRIEGGGSDGWRLHFFCRDLSAIVLLCATGVGECGPGDPANFDAKEFVIQRLRQLERSGRLDTPNDWWWYFD